MPNKPLVKIIKGVHMHEVQAKMQALVEDRGVPDFVQMSEYGTSILVLIIYGGSKINVV